MAKSSGYSASEIMAMQQDAAERVREMQRRARQRMEQGTRPPSPPSAPPAPSQHPAAFSQKPPAAGPLQGLLGDSDRLLLLLLILVLSQEKADPALIMALFWLML